MNSYILVLTEPFLALPICLSVSAFLILWYATLAPEKWTKYSRFLSVYEKMDVTGFLIVVGGIGFIVSVFSFIGHVDSMLNQKTHELGEGIYVYGVFFVSLLFFFYKASFLEKRDIVGLHKQKTKRLEKLMEQHLGEWFNQLDFEGKTKFKTQQIVSKMKNLEIEVKQEKKIRKNKDNLYRSLERLDKMDGERRQLVAAMDQLQKEIAAMYDVLYQLEAIALETRFESTKKQLNVAKEKLKNDPFEAHVYLQQIQKNNQEIKTI